MATTPKIEKPVAEMVSLEIPRETFESARSLVKVLAQALDAAAKKVEADESMAHAESQGADLLAGFGPELTAMSDQSNGMPAASPFVG